MFEEYKNKTLILPTLARGYSKHVYYFLKPYQYQIECQKSLIPGQDSPKINI